MQTINYLVRGQCMILAAAVTIIAGCTPPGPRALLDGKELIDKGQYQAAVEELRLATKLMGTNALAWNYLGLACHHAGFGAEAEKAYQRALVLDRDLSEAHYNLGCLLLEENRLEGARAEFLAYTLRRGNSVDGLARLGTVQLQLRETSAAEKSFGEALKLATNNVEALTGLGLARVQRGRPVEAMPFFNVALKIDPAYRPALLNLAIVAHQQLHDRTLALQKYREYLALQPAPADAEAVRAVVRQLEAEGSPVALQQTNPPVASVASGATAAKTSSPPAVAAATKTVPPRKIEPAVTNQTRTLPPPVKTEPPPVATATKPAPAAVAALPAKPVPTAVIPEPKTEVARVVPAPVPKAAEDVSLSNSRSPALAAPQVKPPAADAATKPISKSIAQRASEGADSALEKTNKLVAAGATSNAPPSAAAPVVKSWPRYAYRNPGTLAKGDSAAAQRAFAQGLQAHQARRLPEAIQAYRSAIQSDPSFFDAQYHLGVASTESGSLRPALGAYEAALAIKPESADARYNFAVVLKQSGYPVDAANELQTLLAKYPTDTRGHVVLGNLYAQQLGDIPKARQHYLRVLETDPRHPQAAQIRYWLADNPR